MQVIEGIRQRKTYLQVGVECIYTYCKEYLGLNKHDAYAFTKVNEMFEQVPELKVAVDSGELAVNKAARILKVIKDDPKYWIKEATERSQRDIELMVADAKPENGPLERAKPIGNGRRAITYTCSEEEYQEDLRIQELESRRLGRSVSLGEARAAAREAYLEKNDPVQKAKRAHIRKVKEQNRQKEQGQAKAAIPTGTQVSPWRRFVERRKLSDNQKTKCENLKSKAQN